MITRPVHDKLSHNMAHSLLVVTPQPNFGEHIRQSLDETNPAHVEIVDDIIAALYEFEKQKFTHAFLDMDMGSSTLLDLGLALRKKRPDLRLVIISSKHSMPRMDVLQPWTLLSKPFHLPDLLRIMREDTKSTLSLSSTNKTPKEKKLVTEKQETLTWLQDVNKAAQHLTRLTLESSAQAALIIRQGEMWAYAGQLSDTASAELVKTVRRDKKTGDLLKFLRLDATQAEHMLYATALAEGIVLSMVFDAETPFSAIRRQATHLAESLAFSLQETSSLPPKPKEEISIKEPKESSPEEDALKRADDELIDLLDFGDEDDYDLPPISDVLENIPDPNPSAAANVKTAAPVNIPITPAPSRKTSIADEPMPNPFAKARAEMPNQYIPSSSREQSPAIQASDFFEANQQVEIDLGETRVQEARSPQSLDYDLGVTRVSRTSRPETPIRKPKPEELKETRPHSITEVAGRVILDPTSSGSGMYDLTYACLLVPRFGTHHLTGDLSERLADWMPNICVAFGWRLELLAVRPDYLQWVINVPPTTSPGYLMRIMRKQTSEKIFEDFPRRKKENPSGDFWAPGYLIMGGSQPHPSRLVEDYIKRTRERQGAGSV